MGTPTVTFASFGARLGLDEARILDSLEEALRRAGPGAGGRYVAPLHPIGDDPTSCAALEEMQARAASGGRGADA